MSIKDSSAHFFFQKAHEQGSYASGKFKIFQGQGIVREFHNLSGKIEFLLKCQGILEFQIKFRFSNKKRKKRNTENG